MKVSHDYKRGARTAWSMIQHGIKVSEILKVFDNPDDDFELGVIAQCEDPETELFPPDSLKHPEESSLRTAYVVAGVALFLLAGGGLLCGYSRMWLPLVVSYLILLRASRLPA